MYNLEFRPHRKAFWNSHPFLDRELNKFFEFSREEEAFAPSCEIVDEEKHYAVSLDIPGLKKDDISIEVKDNHLYVAGERKTQTRTEKENVLRTERRYGKFSRVFTLPQNINAEGIEAKFEDGVLNIVLPKEEKTQSRKISIN